MDRRAERAVALFGQRQERVQLRLPEHDRLSAVRRLVCCRNPAVHTRPTGFTNKILGPFVYLHEVCE